MPKKKSEDRLRRDNLKGLDLNPENKAQVGLKERLRDKEQGQDNERDRDNRVGRSNRSSDNTLQLQPSNRERVIRPAVSTSRTSGLSSLASRVSSDTTKSGFRGTISNSSAIAPGKIAPGADELVSGRFTSIIADLLLRSPKSKNQIAVSLYQEATPEPAEDPLSPLSDRDEIKRTILMYAGLSHTMSSKDFKMYIAEQAGEFLKFRAIRRDEIEDYVNTELDPFINRVENIPIIPAHEINLNAVKSFKAAVEKPAPGDPLAKLSNQELIRIAIHENSNLAGEMTYDSFKGHIASVIIVPLIESKQIAQEGLDQRIEEFREAVARELDGYITGAERALLTDPLRVKNAEMRNLINIVAENNPDNRDLLELAAEHFNRQDRNLRQELKITEQDKENLVRELEAMPIVQAMYAGNIKALAEDGSDDLLKSMDILPETLKQDHFQRSMVAFNKNVTDGLSIFSSLVSREKQPPEDRISNIQVHADTKTEQGGIQIFRADSARINDKVRLSVLDEMQTVVHELGHQVEFHLSTTEWMDIQQILHSRKKTNRLIDIYDNGEEPAYDVDMPATGTYSAKVYPNGDTEVMSMTLEYFSRPVTARDMIQKDPVVAATILRIIRPADFGQQISVGLQELLPRGRQAPAN